MSKLKMKSLSLAGSALLVLCATSAGAATYTLAELDAGTSFTSDDGSLTFANFNVTNTKKLSSDLTLYTVTTTATGFSLSSGEFDAQTGGLRKLDLTYTVTASSGRSISDGTLAVVATRTTGKVKVEKDIEQTNDGDEGTFLLALLTGNTSQLTDTDAISGASFDVHEAVRIKKQSTISSISNEYGTTPVPEPATLSLLGLGLAGLAWSGRRRHSA